MRKTINEVIANLQKENSETTTKKDKKQVNKYLLIALSQITNKNQLVDFEQTNTNRKNSKMSNCLHFNSGVLFEIVLNILLDQANGKAQESYAKQVAKKTDTIYNGKNYEVKLSSKYSYGTKKDNKIQNNIIATINDDGAQVKTMTSDEITWVCINEKQKDGTTKTIKKVDKYQYNGKVDNYLMNLLGW